MVSSHNLKDGGVVLIAEPEDNRGEWPCNGNLYPGDDGLAVRVVKVQSQNKEYI
jgi:hypothetical protein